VITVVGEALLDLIAMPGARVFAAHPGGSPANVAVGLARLGTPVVLATQLGEDLPGRLVVTHLEASGVLVERLPAQSSATSIALASVDHGGAASYDFRITWDVTQAPLLSPDCLCMHTGSIATALDPGAALVEALAQGEQRQGTATISMDPNIRPSLLGSPEEERTRVERQVAFCDIVKVSAEDLQWLYPDTDPRDVARTWLSRGPALVVVTLGADGAYGLTRHAAAARDAPAVRVVDSVGAGDAFTAGLLDALRRAELLGRARLSRLATITSSELADVLDFAIAVASMTCGRAGADPPSRAELRARTGTSSEPGLQI